VTTQPDPEPLPEYPDPRPLDPTRRLYAHTPTGRSYLAELPDLLAILPRLSDEQRRQVAEACGHSMRIDDDDEHYPDPIGQLDDIAEVLNYADVAGPGVNLAVRVRVLRNDRDGLRSRAEAAEARVRELEAARARGCAGAYPLTMRALADAGFTEGLLIDRAEAVIAERDRLKEQLSAANEKLDEWAAAGIAIAAGRAEVLEAQLSEARAKIGRMRPVVEAACRYSGCVRSGTHDETESCGRRDALVAAVDALNPPPAAEAAEGKP
jgi:hypothetical protein